MLEELHGSLPAGMSSHELHYRQHATNNERMRTYAFAGMLVILTHTLVGSDVAYYRLRQVMH